VTEESENLTGASPRNESVAIVVTTFNDAEFLHEALNSIVSQRELASEIIVVDDGSDKSPAAILANFPGVVLLRKNNGGLSSARNAGLRKARSEYITFLDADDRLKANAIAAGLACFREHPDAVMVYGGHHRISADGKRLGDDNYRALSDDPYADFLSGNIVGMHATVLYRREIVEAAGGFDEGLPMCEDYDLYLRLSRDYRIASHSAIIAEYRWHQQNMSKNTQEMLRTVLFVHKQHRNQTRERQLAWQTGRRRWKRWYTVEQRALWEGANGNLKPGVRVASTIRQKAKAIGKRGTARLSRFLRRGRPPHVGSIDFGDLGTTRPISLDFGWDRGRPIDRYYIEAFLVRQAHDIAGRVLEVGDDAYSRTYGGAKISRQDVLHVESGNPKATLIGDLTDPGVLPAGAFDCIVLTQTLHLIFDLTHAVTCLHAALKPGGVLLLTTPGISQVDRGEWGSRWCWALTAVSLRRLFETAFAPESLTIESHGNVFAAVAYLTGAVCEDVDLAKLDEQDSAYPVIITMRAQKA
jgi:SAM-dependent methyltransferase